MDEEKYTEDNLAEEIQQLMDGHDIDTDTAEKAQELIEEGFDEDDAVELANEI